MAEHRGVPDVEATLHQLEQLVADAKAVPLSASVMVNRAEIEGLLSALREALPDARAYRRLSAACADSHALQTHHGRYRHQRRQAQHHNREYP